MEDLEIYKMIEDKVEGRLKPLWKEVAGMRVDIKDLTSSVLKMQMTIVQVLDANGNGGFMRAVKVAVIIGTAMAAIFFFLKRVGF